MNQQRGFSLTELIIVIVVVGILVAYTSTYLDRAGFDLNSITDQLKRDIRFTQALAMSINTSYSITITSGGYTISPTPIMRDASTTVPNGVTLTPQTITFDANGAPGAGSTVTVTTASGSSVLTLYAETGFVQ